MTVTAMTAVALDHILAEDWRRSDTDPLGRARQAQRQMVRTSAAPGPWPPPRTCATPWTEGARLDLPTRIMHRYADRVLEVANGNPKVNTAFVNVVNLRHSPTSSSAQGPPGGPGPAPSPTAPVHRPPPGRCRTDLTDSPRPGPPSRQMERQPDPLNRRRGRQMQGMAPSRPGRPPYQTPPRQVGRTRHDLRPLTPPSADQRQAGTPWHGPRRRRPPYPGVGRLASRSYLPGAMWRSCISQSRRI